MKGGKVIRNELRDSFRLHPVSLQNERAAKVNPAALRKEKQTLNQDVATLMHAGASVAGVDHPPVRRRYSARSESAGTISSNIGGSELKRSLIRKRVPTTTELSVPQGAIASGPNISGQEHSSAGPDRTNVLTHSKIEANWPVDSFKRNIT